MKGLPTYLGKYLKRASNFTILKDRRTSELVVKKSLRTFQPINFYFVKRIFTR